MAFVPSALLTVSVLCGGVCGALVLPAALSKALGVVNRSRLQAKVIGRDKERNDFIAGLCRNGVVVVRPVAKLLISLSFMKSNCKRCVQALEVKGYIAHDSAVCEALIAAAGMLVLVLLLLTKNLVVAICVVVVAVFLVFGRAHKTMQQWESRLVEQIPDALRSFGICFNAGYSLQQAFEQAALDTPAPLGSELEQASFDVNAGRSIEEALSALEKRTQATDLRFAIVALEIQHRTGGSLQELLENAADAVVASCDLRRQLAVQTAQARLSAKVVTILPLVLVVLLSLAMDGYLQAFFSSPAGFAILITALGMELLGVLLIRKILGVDLG